MKNILIVGLLTFGLCDSMMAQKINQNEAELTSLLCHQWEIDYAMVGEMKLGQIPGATDLSFKFRSNGTYDIMKENRTQTGNWTYYPDGKYVALSIKGTTTSRIASISKHELILVMTPLDGGPPGTSKIAAHFRPVH